MTLDEIKAAGINIYDPANQNVYKYEIVLTYGTEKYGREARTVGFPLGGVEIAITPEGEVICRGHNVMMGYFKNDEGTREIIDADGWLHTGDLGHFTAKGQLVLTGRKKNLFKTSMGKYVNPQVIEDRLVRSPFIENAVVVGENQRFAAALIIPDFTFLKVWCENNKVSFTSNKEIVNNQKVIMRIKKEVDECNRMLGKAENIMNIRDYCTAALFCCAF